LVGQVHQLPPIDFVEKRIDIQKPLFPGSILLWTTKEKISSSSVVCREEGEEERGEFRWMSQDKSSKT